MRRPSSNAVVHLRSTSWSFQSLQRMAARVFPVPCGAPACARDRRLTDARTVHRRYEKWAIEKWVKERKDANKPVTSPVTGVEFGHNELTLNRAVQGHILLRYPKLSTAAYEQAADFAQTGAESGRGARITTSPPSVGPMARSAVQAIAASKIDKGKSVDEIVPAAASAKVRGQVSL